MSLSYEDAINQIKNQLDILEIISEEVILKKKGSNYWGLCPFHGEKTPSFSVNPERGFFKCFGCGVGGDAITFLMKIHNWDYTQTIRYLAERYHVELPEFSGKSNSSKEEKSLIKDIYNDAVKFYQDILLGEASDNVAVKYLGSRDITPAVISNFSLGLALKETDLLYKNLRKKYDDSIIEKSGVVLKSNNGSYIDRFRNRIIIPIQNEQGEYIAFGARAIEEGQNPKYLNSSDSIIYNKSRILYGLFSAKEAIKQEDAVIIMEGYFDVISAQAHGIKNAVASCGTSLTLEHVKILSKYTKSRRIYLSFDTDLAGQNATKRGGELIKNAFQGLGNIKQFDDSHVNSNQDKYSCEIRVISPPEGKDPDEYIRTSGADAFKAYINNAPLLLDFELNGILKKKDNYKSPQEKSDLIKQIVPILTDIQNPIIQSEYVKIVSTALSIDENAIKKELEINNSLNFINKDNYYSLNSSKNIPISDLAQKNMLSLYFTKICPFSLQMIDEKIKSVNFTNKTLIIVKNTIDKLLYTVNNVSELISKLYDEFSNDKNLQELLTDLICMSEAFSGLKEDDFGNVIHENIEKIEKCRLEEEHKQFKEIYDKANNDEVEALKVQMQLKDKIKQLRTGDFDD